MEKCQGTQHYPLTAVSAIRMSQLQPILPNYCKDQRYTFIFEFFFKEGYQVFFQFKQNKNIYMFEM